MFKNKIKVLMIALFCFVFLGNAYAKSDTTYDELRKMIDIMEIIDNKYVEERENKDLVIGAIRGLVRTLDPYSQYMTEKDYKEMKTETQGSFGGVGIRITIQNNELTVVTPMPDTPAYYAGILPEDKIIKIDDKSTQDITSDEAVKLMRGNPGTKVVLTIYRPSTKEELTFTIIRKKIKIETVKKKMLEDNIGYIRLSEFNAQSYNDVSSMLKELSKENMKAFILDLRNNPGGLLDSAINICSLFIKEDSLVVSTKCKDKTMEQYYYTQKKPDYSDIPVVVLINRGSASASEIVTGTLQDYKRALVIGSNSFGKGTVQTILPLSDGSALRLTIAKYCLPSGKMISHSDNKKDKKNGVAPDVYVEVSPETEGKLYMQAESEGTPKNKDKKEEIVRDEVLDTAIKIIKANKVSEYIEKPSKYEQDFPKEEKKDLKEEDNTETKTEKKDSKKEDK
ncbi:S41 family peptidase [Candidatus Ruminimicrobiellum ovillum]|uniref:S41 family peptidase n=1 Tax=Candidatus Ruminimicrobiellum ovillum TaxID=1947927 RepID=UPI003559A05B